MPTVITQTANGKHAAMAEVIAQRSSSIMRPELDALAFAHEEIAASLFSRHLTDLDIHIDGLTQETAQPETQTICH